MPNMGIMGAYAGQALKGYNDSRQNEELLKSRQLQNQSEQQRMNWAKEDRPYQQRGLQRQDQLSQMMFTEAQRKQHEAQFDNAIRQVLHQYSATGDPQVIADAMSKGLGGAHKYTAVKAPDGTIIFGDESGNRRRFASVDDFMDKVVNTYRDPNVYFEDIKARKSAALKRSEKMMDQAFEYDKMDYGSKLKMMEAGNQSQLDIQRDAQKESEDEKKAKTYAKWTGVSMGDALIAVKAKDPWEKQKAAADAKVKVHNSLIQAGVLQPGSKEFNEALEAGKADMDAIYSTGGIARQTQQPKITDTMMGDQVRRQDGTGWDVISRNPDGTPTTRPGFQNFPTMPNVGMSAPTIQQPRPTAPAPSEGLMQSDYSEFIGQPFEPTDPYLTATGQAQIGGRAYQQFMPAQAQQINPANPTQTGAEGYYGIPMRAQGGPVEQGQPYVVGEEGTEQYRQEPVGIYEQMPVNGETGQSFDPYQNMRTLAGGIMQRMPQELRRTAPPQPALYPQPLPQEGFPLSREDLAKAAPYSVAPSTQTAFIQRDRNPQQPMSPIQRANTLLGGMGQRIPQEVASGFSGWQNSTQRPYSGSGFQGSSQDAGIEQRPAPQPRQQINFTYPVQPAATQNRTPSAPPPRRTPRAAPQQQRQPAYQQPQPQYTPTPAWQGYSDIQGPPAYAMNSTVPTWRPSQLQSQPQSQLRPRVINGLLNGRFEERGNPMDDYVSPA